MTDICYYHGNHLGTKHYLKTEKDFIPGKKYSPKFKHGLPDALSKEYSFECLSVMIYEQFVSIVELIMLSWQPILYNI